MIHDLKYAVRTLSKRPGFSAIVVLTLALGIGANTAIFSVVNGVLLRPLPYEDPHELVLMTTRMTNTDEARGGVSAPDFVDYRQEVTLLEDVAATWAMGTNLGGDDGIPEQITLSWVSPNYFSLLGVSPVLGRTFAAEDKTSTDLDVITDPNFTPPPAPTVISYGLWQRRFGGDTGVLGQTLRINGQGMVVI